MTHSSIEVVRQHALPIAVIRRQAHPSELSRVVPELCGRVWTAVKAQHAHAGRHVAVYWDDRIRIEVGVELHGRFVDDGEVVQSATPAGTVARVTHLGPYGELAVAHDAIHQWVHRDGRDLAGPRWEIYGHWEQEWNADASKIRTDIYYLLTP